MKSYGKLWDKIIDADNLVDGWFAFRKHHANAPGAAQFQRKLEANIESIRQRLSDGTWAPGFYHQFKVFEPKPRIITCCSVPDRVVHHAFCQICAPLMERRFIDQSYACRKGLGSHMAILRARAISRRHPYFLKIDVRKYFDNVDHVVLEEIIASIFRESQVRELARRIIERVKVRVGDLILGWDKASSRPRGKGLPIGNLTSQWFANLYLDGFDHYCAESLRLGLRYMRYMDDILVFTDSKEEAWELMYAMREWLWRNRQLQLKDEATIVAPVTSGVPYLGLIIRPDGWRLRPSRLRRTKRSVRKHYESYRRGECSADQFQNILRSMEGNARYFGFKGIFSSTDQMYFDGWGYEKRESEDGFPTGNRANRGGNYNNTAGNCSSAYRNNNSASNANANNGVRLGSAFCAQISQEETCGYSRPHSDYPVLGEGVEPNMHLAAAGAVREALGLCFPPRHRSRFSLSLELHKTK